MRLLLVIPFLCVFGLILGIIAYRKMKFKRFAAIGIWINSFVLLFSVVIIVINAMKYN